MDVSASQVGRTLTLVRALEGPRDRRKREGVGM